MKRFWLLGLVGLFLLAPAPAPADAARYPQLETATDGYTRSDGARFVAWVVDSNVRVLDDATGKVMTFPLPEGCDPIHTLRAGRAATVCGSEFRLLNVRTGAWTTIPPTPASAALFQRAVGISRVGRFWLAVRTFRSGYGETLGVAWINRRTGQVRRDSGKLRRYPNVDARGLWRPLCAPLTRRRSPWDTGPRFLGPQMSGRYGLERDGNSFFLRQCGTKEVRVLTRSGLATGEWFRAGRVTWIEQTGSLLFRDKKCDDGCVRTYDTETGRFRTFTQTMFAQEVVHTRRHIFFDDDSDIVDDVTYRYRIRL